MKIIEVLKKIESGHIIFINDETDLIFFDALIINNGNKSIYYEDYSNLGGYNEHIKLNYMDYYEPVNFNNDYVESIQIVDELIVIYIKKEGN